ncbi:glycoprotein 3-alpha-L-fucosyltransferase A-like [Mercenaria mercenaria]|uniref:glycoprotein 3-alpha-L-fucosyltransferase A-like n=1 Tax=Mercenaria mercenaria TaxID=6596 RepID=UPI00234F88BE|nr:glycoprotein 3-alpha-L-fucosyltransferase A-like [Mercenaria mercenaria]XP_045191865.2 glycoprotein 3-alpha-L-fucosyltransferase A-like [Mercenaria mercenaria]
MLRYNPMRSAISRRRKFLLFIVGLSMLSTYLIVGMVYNVPKVDEVSQWEEKTCHNYSRLLRETRNNRRDHKKYLITWYSVSPYIKWRPEALARGFKMCKYNNCEMSLCKRTSEHSDAVIFNGRRLPENYEFKRPFGQIWIFAEDETPYTYNFDTQQWKSKYWRSAFNWTMTYDSENTDIYLPCGDILKKKARDSRDFRGIARNKTRDALLITSHCSTESKRSEYVKELQKYIDVDVLGACGRKWECGKLWVHDECFEILNTTYRFYLAFENALCQGYRTEKFFENFNYDIILVERAGISKDDIIEPKDIYISTSDFPNVERLGRHLKKLSNDIDEYAGLLERKSQYYSPGFHEPYQMALCNLCEKMNAQEKYHREINDLVNEHARLLTFCKDPTDIKV